MRSRSVILASHDHCLKVVSEKVVEIQKGWETPSWSKDLPRSILIDKWSNILTSTYKRKVNKRGYVDCPIMCHLGGIELRRSHLCPKHMILRQICGASDAVCMNCSTTRGPIRRQELYFKGTHVFHYHLCRALLRKLATKTSSSLYWEKFNQYSKTNLILFKNRM